MKSFTKITLIAVLAYFCLSISPHHGQTVNPEKQVYQEKNNVVPLDCKNLEQIKITSLQIDSVLNDSAKKLHFFVFTAGYKQQISSTEYLRNFHKYKGKPIPIVPKYNIACL